MAKPWLSLLCGLLVAAALLNAPSARAECTASTIERMAARGKTVAAIARICEISQQDVKDIIDGANDASGGGDPGAQGAVSGPTTPSLLPRGTPVGQCGCWGPADPNVRVPQAQCASGSAQPRTCGVPCAAGGVAWQGVCS